MNTNPNTATHLCETCKSKDKCSLAGEIDNGYFDEVLMDRVNDNDREDKNPALTTMVIECKEYEKEGV